MTKIYPRPNYKTLQFTIVLTLLAFSQAYGSHNGKSKPVFGKKPNSSEAKASAWLRNQPVEFLENRGQLKDMAGNPVPYVLFKAEAPGLDLYVTEKGLSYVFLKGEEEEGGEEMEKEDRRGHSKEEKLKMSYERIDMQLAGASIKRENIVKEDTGLAYFNYLMGPGSTVSHVKKYRKLTIKNVYPGIDWVLYNSTRSGFKYDFIVHPGADAAQVGLLYKSKRELLIDADGGLNIKTFCGMLKENAPYSYLEQSGQEAKSSFRLVSKQKKNGLTETLLAFDVENSAGSALVIDPQLVWATFYGGTGLDGTTAIDSDTLGNIFITGYGTSTDLPLLNAGTYFQSTACSPFIAKFSNNGVLLWSTYYSAGNTVCYFLDVDNNGNVFLCGTTNATNFPVLNNSTYFQAAIAGANDCFISKFDNAGNNLWATLYGGTQTELALAVTTDQGGNVYMVGTTSSNNFPLQNAGSYFDGTISGSSSGFIVKFDNNGNRFWATYLKGITTPGLCTDPNGNVYVVSASLTGGTMPLFNPGGSSYYQATASGNDGCILKFSPNGTLRWGTYYGGTGQEALCSVAADKRGNVFMVGWTLSTDLPVQNAGTFFQASQAGQGDAFLLKFDSTCVRLWGTYLGGSRGEMVVNVDNLSIDTCGNLYVGFHTRSPNIPLMGACEGGFYDNSLDTAGGPSKFDVYTARFFNDGTLRWASFLGGDGHDFRSSTCIDRYGNYFMTGEWVSPTSPGSYPLTNPGASAYFSQPFLSDDSYVVKFAPPSSLPAQSFSYTGAYCLSDTNRLPVKAPGFAAGGTFTAGTGLSISPLTGWITPSLSVPGTYTVNYLMQDCLCPNPKTLIKGTTTVTILATPVLTVSGNYTICTGKLATFIASGANSYSWNIGSQSPTITLTAPTVTTVLNYTVTGYANGGSCSAKKTFSVLVSRCTGIEELSANGALLTVYPNPNQGEFTISSSVDASFGLVNVLGQVVRQVELSTGNDRTVIVRGLPPGSYFIKDKSGHVSARHKIIVNE